MQKWCKIIALAALYLPLLSSGNVWAETAEEKGLAVAREADHRGEGFGDFVADMEMTLRNKQGEETKRKIRIRTLEVATNGDKSLSIFDDPPDVAGTAMLTFSHKTQSDDQWLYLPALKRVKRIASNNKSGPFMGSEFAYEDIGSQEVEKYTYKYLRDEKCNGMDCFVYERYPVDENSGYTRQIVWLDKQEYRQQKIEYYDRKNALLKTLTVPQYRKFLENHWRPMEIFMENHQTGKSTRLFWKNYRFRTGLKDKDFQVDDLMRLH
ncbi:MAG: outer membrane lipoprotein-sorting protein [Gammaproteobacteria bacterium]|nr:outer membrane lipoprotein-sorting protein [Gammaproteobacteria bacterium]